MILNTGMVPITSRPSSSSFLRTISDFAVECLAFLRRIWKFYISPQRPTILTQILAVFFSATSNYAVITPFVKVPFHYLSYHLAIRRCVV